MHEHPMDKCYPEMIAKFENIYQIPGDLPEDARIALRLDIIGKRSKIAMDHSRVADGWCETRITQGSRETEDSMAIVLAEHILYSWFNAVQKEQNKFLRLSSIIGKALSHLGVE